MTAIPTSSSTIIIPELQRPLPPVLTTRQLSALDDNPTEESK